MAVLGKNGTAIYLDFGFDKAGKKKELPPSPDSLTKATISKKPNSEPGDPSFQLSVTQETEVASRGSIASRMSFSGSSSSKKSPNEFVFELVVPPSIYYDRNSFDSSFTIERQEGTDGLFTFEDEDRGIVKLSNSSTFGFGEGQLQGIEKITSQNPGFEELLAAAEQVLDDVNPIICEHFGPMGHLLEFVLTQQTTEQKIVRNLLRNQVVGMADKVDGMASQVEEMEGQTGALEGKVEAQAATIDEQRASLDQALVEYTTLQQVQASPFQGSAEIAADGKTITIELNPEHSSSELQYSTLSFVEGAIRTFSIKANSPESETESEGGMIGNILGPATPKLTEVTFSLSLKKPQDLDADHFVELQLPQEEVQKLTKANVSITNNLKHEIAFETTCLKLKIEELKTKYAHVIAKPAAKVAMPPNESVDTGPIDEQAPEFISDVLDLYSHVQDMLPAADASQQKQLEAIMETASANATTRATKIAKSLSSDMHTDFSEDADIQRVLEHTLFPVVKMIDRVKVEIVEHNAEPPGEGDEVAFLTVKSQLAEMRRQLGPVLPIAVGKFREYVT